MHIQELGKPWLRTKNLFEEQNRVNEIYSWSLGFVFRQKFPPSDGHRGRRSEKDSPGRRDVPSTKDGSIGIQPP